MSILVWLEWHTHTIVRHTHQQTHTHTHTHTHTYTLITHNDSIVFLQTLSKVKTGGNTPERPINRAASSSPHTHTL